MKLDTLPIFLCTFFHSRYYILTLRSINFYQYLIWFIQLTLPQIGVFQWFLIVLLFSFCFCRDLPWQRMWMEDEWISSNMLRSMCCLLGKEMYGRCRRYTPLKWAIKHLFLV